MRSPTFAVELLFQCRKGPVRLIDAVAKCMVYESIASTEAMPDHIAQSPNAFPTRGNWTDEQLKLAFSFYCQTPFGKLHNRNPAIVQLADLIGRTPSALAMKLVNFASLDPSVTSTGRTGLTGASAKDRAIWEAFHVDWEGLAVECEEIGRRLLHEHGLPSMPPAETGAAFALDDYTGETRCVLTQQRIRQDFFRRAVLASYRGRCCVSGVSDSRLLIASHIVPWSEDKANRLNPRNGLCLSAIHDKAFDQHLFTLGDDSRIILSTQLLASKNKFIQDVFWPTVDRPITLPDRFLPDPAFIQKHREITLAD